MGRCGKVGLQQWGSTAQWQAVFTNDGDGTGNPNAEDKCGVVKEDYIKDLLAAMKMYEELMQGCEQHQRDTCALVAASVAELARDPVAALVDLAPAPSCASLCTVTESFFSLHCRTGGPVISH